MRFQGKDLTTITLIVVAIYTESGGCTSLRSRIHLYQPGKTEINFPGAVVFYDAPTPMLGVSDDFLVTPTNQAASDFETRFFVEIKVEMLRSLVFTNPPNTDLVGNLDS